MCVWLGLVWFVREALVKMDKERKMERHKQGCLISQCGSPKGRSLDENKRLGLVKNCLGVTLNGGNQILINSKLSYS
ncbi:hypothetical protein Lalb_Chr18g0046111 [Lupinus albus]|uniref:Uncharacterized protein n=1 Tax=Lupinus albus TaxID=3870 RepID=A0A6A4NWI7_LUPAL|nr:hypothetical protein Lalb_Chr18g0046111 [Lupinus albus]